MRVFETAFRIRREEFWRVQIFFLYSLSIGMFYTLGEAVGDALFLSRMPQASAERLFSWVYIGVGLTTVLATRLYGLLQKRISRGILMIATPLLLSLSLILFREAIKSNHAWVYFGLNLWLETCALLCLTLFFSFAGDYFTSRDARRLYAYIAGGSAAGALLAGSAVEPLAELLGPDNLLYVCAGLLILPAVWVLILRSLTGAISQIEEESLPQAPSRSFFSNAYLRLICGMVLAGWISCVLVDYQMKVFANRRMPEIELTAFLGRFYGYGGLASLIVEFLIAGWLFRHAGILKSLLVLPFLLAAGSMGFLVHPALFMIVAVNLAATVLSETLDLPARELLLLPLPRRLRILSQTFVDGMLVPLGYVLGGALLVFFVEKIPALYYLSGMAFVFSCLWLLFIFWLFPLYKKTLSATLISRHLDSLSLEKILESGQSETVISNLLKSPDPEVAASALELLKGRPLGGLKAQVLELSASPHEAVACLSLRLLAFKIETARQERGSPEATSSLSRDETSILTLRRAANDSRAPVASSAIFALCELLREKAISDVTFWLEDGDPERRQAVFCGLALHGGAEGHAVIRPRLLAMLKDPRFEEKVEALEALEKISWQAADADFLGDTSLISAALALWSDVRLRSFVLGILRDLPASAAGPLAQAVKDASLESSSRSAFAFALGNSGGPVAASVLWEVATSSEDLPLRLNASSALQSLKAREGLHGFPLGNLDACANRLCEEIGLIHQACLMLGRQHSPERELFLDHARLQKVLLLNLILLREDTQRPVGMARSLFGKSEALRANALELLEVVLPGAVRQKALPVFIWREDSASSPDGGLSPDAIRDLRKAGGWVRGIVQFHLEHIGRSEYPGGEDMKKEQDLYRIISVVSFLKQVDLFREIPADELASLAAVVKERHLYTGERLFSEGDPGDALYLICEGRVRVMVGEREVAVLGPRECIGEMALLDGAPRAASAVVREEARLFRLSSDDFRNLLPTQPAISTALLSTLARRLRQTLAHSSAAATH